MKSKVRINRIMFPKGTYKTQAGDFSIFTAEVVEHLDGDQPLINELYGTITLKGNVPAIKSGDEFVAVYDNPETNNFGTSYSLNMLTKEVDKTNKQQVREYLKILCGGEVVANELMKLDDPLGLIERQDSEELLKVKGIGKKRLESIYKGLAESSDFSLAYAELMPFGLSKTMVTKICKTYGSATIAIELCTTNPYALCRKVKGISFSIADDIAKKCQLDMSSKDRIECAIYHILNENGASGKTYLYSNQLLTILHDLIPEIDFNLINECVVKMQADGTIMLLNEGNEIALTYYFNLEREIAIELKRLAIAPNYIEVPNNWRDIVSDLEKEQGWEHTDEQMHGIESVLFNNVVVITGKAGSGKSTITNAMCRVLDDYKISMTCLSAKASQRISEVTGRPASTIHRLLGIGKKKVDINNLEKLYTDILILDESSMPSGELYLMLLRSLRDGTKVIILGDDGQLQAIGDCSVFSDLLTVNKKTLPIIRLTKIHRQAQESAIITKSIDIRNQIELYEKGFVGHTILGKLQDLELFIQQEKENLINIVIEKFFEELSKQNNDVLEVQIITAVKSRGNLSTFNINRMVQEKYNQNALIESANKYTTKADVTLFEGDKVINMKNNYKTKDINGDIYPVFNGNIGIITEILEDVIRVEINGNIIEFSGTERDSLNLAYAITVHSSQGSQWESVICTFDISMWMLLNVEMLYTAMTRASKMCTLIAEDRAIKQAIRTVEQKTKQTYLSRFIFYMFE